MRASTCTRWIGLPERQQAGMTDGILLSVAVGLIEQMNPPVDDDRARRTETLVLRRVRDHHLALLLPHNKVVTRCDADAPTLYPFSRRNGVV